MPGHEELRRRLAAAGADLPDELVDLVVQAAGALATALEDLVGLDLGDAEPFVPSRRLVDDAGA
jgi:hypothetical protein